QREQCSLDGLKGKRVAIDAYNTIYQFLTIIRQPDGTPLSDSRGRVTSHLSGLFYRTCNLLEKGIRPCFVFDGTPSELKRRTIEERKARKAEAEEALRKAREEGRTEEVAMLVQRTVRITPDIVEESKSLLELMGVPWVQAPSEGEAQCAVMAAAGVVDCTGSQDYDALLFGSPLLVRNITIAGRRKLPRRNLTVEVFPEIISLESNLAAFGISREKLVWIGMLCGTDFNEGVRGIGPKKGLKLVKECDSLESLAAALGEKASGFDVAPVLDLFLNPASVPVRREEVELRAPQREKLLEFMHGEHDFSPERLESSIKKAFKEPEDDKQATLKKWFS
ncbi:MAG: flap endonuclease-1, partial [Candidatus Micrarchaeota archaeon]